MNSNPELLKAIANTLSTLSVLLTNLVSQPAEEKETKSEEPAVTEQKKTSLSLVDLRKQLGAYSIAGHTEKIQKILSQHGVRLLKELPESEYETVLQEVKVACE